MITTQPIEGAFGKEILGVDLSNPSSDDITEVLRIFHENGLILVRNQEMTLSQFEELALHFGDIKPHFLDHLRLEGHPGILLLSNMYENEKPIGVYDGAAFWHTDVAYEDPPNSSTLVYGVEYPTNGCPTHYATTFEAYDALSGSLKAKIEDLTVLHHYGNRADMDEDSGHSAVKLTDDQKKKVENVFHPLVMKHPVTGRKSLYGVAGSSFGIVGMPDDEAIDLLDELKDHCLQDQFTTTLEIERGDFAAWDTFSTLHMATLQKKATGPEDSRLLWRASMVGMPPSLRSN